MILQLNHLTKTFKSGERSLIVLSDITFTLEEGSSTAIVGPSGSGKTTLLGLCAGLDTPTSGTVTLCGESMSDLTEDERAKLRSEKVGFIFQTFHLISTLTAIENVLVPLEIRGVMNGYQKAVNLLDSVGLGDRLTHYPSQLSGGEQQRVAIARAFINKPAILFADEPTGNLDDDTGSDIESLLFNLNKEAGTTLLLVTHDLELASKTDRIIRLRSGLLESYSMNRTVFA